mmetsp:Transcript_20739/g.37983  ORF Transcript_20739/g.37983 Transcript_20739/m.37983 type:complete len:490 (+) Transcript_20739:143-1612(+)
MSRSPRTNATELTPLARRLSDSVADSPFWSLAHQVILVGTGFLADAYDLFVIDMVMSILHRLHPAGMDPWYKSLVASATLVGAIVGQLSFGLLGDWLGRKWTFIASCVLIIVGAVLSGCCLWTDGHFSIFYQLALCRFLLGVGVGAEYPLAASIAAEGATNVGIGRHRATYSRGRLIAGVFSMQGWGMLLSCVFVMLFLSVGMPLEYIWRCLLILGALPSAAIIYCRSRMEESFIYRKAKEDVAAKGEADTLVKHLGIAAAHVKRYWRPLTGTTMTWLLLDVTFYGTGSFKHRISGWIMDHRAGSVREEIWDEAVFAAICASMAMPGYLLSVLYIDRLGRYRIQFWGFVAMAVNFFLISLLSWSDVRLAGVMRWWMLICFGFTFLFSNFGPNTTTFVLPAEVYPTLIRATCHGISAAAGKLGAVIGVVAFSPCEQEFGLESVLAGCGVVCIVGALFTYFFTTEKVVELEELDAAPDLPAAPKAGRRGTV